MKPKWKHDCDRCEYVMSTQGRMIEDRTDWYVCPTMETLMAFNGEFASPVIVARYGDDPAKYGTPYLIHGKTPKPVPNSWDGHSSVGESQIIALYVWQTYQESHQ